MCGGADFAHIHTQTKSPGNQTRILSLTSPPPLPQLQATSRTHRQPPRGQAHVIHTPTPPSQIGHVDTNSRPHTQRHTPVCAWTHIQSPLTHIHTNNCVHKLTPRDGATSAGRHPLSHTETREECRGTQPCTETCHQHISYRPQVNSIMTISEIPAPSPTELYWGPTMCQGLF